MPSVLTNNQIDHYALGNLIATSTEASTYQGTDLRTGCQVAIKIPHVEGRVRKRSAILPALLPGAVDR
jgi:hypothetical protein